MLSYYDALNKILAHPLSALECEELAITDALGRVLAVSQCSPMQTPPFDNSAMDGYAIAAADYVEGVAFQVSQRIRAGDATSPLQKATVARIFTGAVLPANADSVIIQENAKQQGDHVVFTGALKHGQHVRFAGEDIQKDAIVLAKGHHVNARSIGLLASLGVESLVCYRKIRIALVATGNELQEAGKALNPGQIYNSNYPMLKAELEALGAEVLDQAVCVDNPEATFRVLEQASKRADVVMTIGGMSVGEEDYVKAAAESMGELNFWKVAIKPGKPLAFGQLGKALFFGLPGNPVSSFVTYLLFAKPLLKKMMGLPVYKNKLSLANSAFTYQNKGARCEFVRVKLHDANNNDQLPVAELFHNQSSGILSSLVFADALAMVDAGESIANGDGLTVIKL